MIKVRKRRSMRADTHIDNHALQAAAEQVGGVEALAELLQVAGPTVYQWRSGSRRVPAHRAVEIEALTGVKAEFLAPHFPWKKIRVAA